MHPLLAALRKNFRFVLVSGSPRRQELLSGLGLDFTVFVPEVPEHIRAGRHKQDIVKVTLAKLNAAPARPGQILIACDTIVVCNGRVLGKPRSPKEAAGYLQLLSGRKHTVYSCLALKVLPKHGAAVVRARLTATRVYFRTLAGEEIAAYVRTPLPYDKAGAYGIQETNWLFVRKIEGCFYNVMGLPVNSLIAMLKAIKQ